MKTAIWKPRLTALLSAGVLLIGLAGIAAAAGYLVAGTWGAVIALGFAVVSTVGGSRYANQYVMRSIRAQPLNPRQSPRLYASAAAIASARARNDPRDDDCREAAFALMADQARSMRTGT